VTVWEKIAERLREHAEEQVWTHSPPVRRATVLRPSPLSVELDGEVLDRGDDDVEVDAALITTPPAVGDVVIVHTDQHGDYLISGLVKGS
jgi:hypothetical protein